MYGVSSNLALEYQKQRMMTSMSAQNEGEKKKLDVSPALLSVFGYQLRQNIQQKAAQCNLASIELLSSRPKEEGARVMTLCGGVNAHLEELQDTISWAGQSTADLANIADLSSAAKIVLKSTINETINFGKQVMTNSVNTANEAITKVAEAKEAPEAVKTEVKQSQHVVENVAKQETQVQTDNIYKENISQKTEPETISETTEKVEPKTTTETPIETAKAETTSIDTTPAVKDAIAKDEIKTTANVDVKTPTTTKVSPILKTAV